MQELINNIKSSPLFFIFAESKELFHSNFWYWLSVSYPDIINKVFGLHKQCDNYEYKREHRQSFNNIKSKVDLVVSCNGSFKLVIENKIKDFPSTEQLTRIIDSFNNQNVTFVLTTLFNYKNLSFKKWQIFTYKQISNAIEPNGVENTYHKQLISDYKSFTSNLSELADSVPITDNYDFAFTFNEELHNNLNNVKLLESYLKMRASHMLCNYEKPFEFIETRFGIHLDKNNVTIDFIYPLKNDYSIGVQIQGNQVRKFISGENHNEFSDNLLSEDLFFRSQWRSPNKLQLLKYNPNFKYQYIPIVDKLSFDVVFCRINSILRWIHSKKELIESKMPSP